MNLIDFIIIGIVGVSVLFGFYRGFVSSVLNVGGGLLAFGLSFVMYPHLAAFIQGNEEFVRTMVHYTDASSRLGDLNLAVTNVVQLGQQGIQDVLSKVALPAPLDKLLETNLTNQVYASSGVATVSDYVSQTVVQAGINILCFLASFIILYIVLAIVINAIKAVFRLPLLKQLDWLAGGVFGFLRGLLICLACFTLVPLVMTVVPVDFVTEMIDQSTLAPIFSSGNLILSIMNGRL